MKNNEYETHESYGMISISHVQGCSSPLFGSSIKHDRTIQLRINKGAVKRDLHQERYSADENIIEVELSAAQFATFITTPNVGSGVPCTIRRVEGKQMEYPDYKGHNEVFQEELREDVRETMLQANELAKEARGILSKKGALKVADRDELLNSINSLTQHINSNMPFLHRQFAKSMEKTVTAAKSEIEQFYTSTIMKMGKKALAENGGIDIPMIEEK